MSFQILNRESIVDQHQTHICIDQLCAKIDKSLQRWGKYRHDRYVVFQPVVEMQLKAVEKYAQRLVRLEANKVDCQRDVIEIDHQKAVWTLLRKAIIGLEPSLLMFDRQVMLALQQVSKTGEWPKNVLIPPECHRYLALSFAYVWKSKSTTEVARLFGVAKRSLATIRSHAIWEVTQRLLAWERHCSTMH